MSINTQAPSLSQSIRPEIASNDFEQIEQNAAKNSINLAAVPTPQITDRTLEDLYKLGKASEKVQAEKPQSLFSKMVQWFNRVILRKKEEVDAGDDAALNDKGAYSLPLEKPSLVDSKAVDDFIAIIEKFAKIKSDELDELRGEKDLYKMIMKAGLRHHERINAHRIQDHKIVLDSHKETEHLKNLRKELNVNLMNAGQSQKFWNRVNTGLSTACALTALASRFQGGSPLGVLSAFAAISSGITQIAGAQSKHSSEVLTGESKALNEELSALRTMTETELKVLSKSSEALLQLFTHLAEINQKHYRVNTMALSDR